jgi:hypothetical protein
MSAPPAVFCPTGRGLPQSARVGGSWRNIIVELPQQLLVRRVHRAAPSHQPRQVIVLKRKDAPYRSGRSPDWLKMKNANAPAVKREDEEDWGT